MKYIFIKGITKLQLGEIQIDDINDVTVMGKITFIKVPKYATDVFYITIHYNGRSVKYFERDIIKFEDNILEVTKIK